MERDLTPESVQDLAVAASWATAANPVHVLPAQRSTVTDVALVVALLIHARLILARLLELAARFVGAVGTPDAPGVTLMLATMEAVATPDAPVLSVTVRDAAYVPGSVYT